MSDNYNIASHCTIWHDNRSNYKSLTRDNNNFVISVNRIRVHGLVFRVYD